MSSGGLFGYISGVVEDLKETYDGARTLYKAVTEDPDGAKELATRIAGLGLEASCTAFNEAYDSFKGGRPGEGLGKAFGVCYKFLEKGKAGAELTRSLLDNGVPLNAISGTTGYLRPSWGYTDVL